MKKKHTLIFERHGFCEHCGEQEYGFYNDDEGVSWCHNCADANDLITDGQFKKACKILEEIEEKLENFWDDVELKLVKEI